MSYDTLLENMEKQPKQQANSDENVAEMQQREGQNELFCPTEGALFQIIQMQKEEQAIKDWIYKGKEDDNVIPNVPISPKLYSKGYEFMQQMGYPGHGPLHDKKHALVEPLDHTHGQEPHDTTGLGYGEKYDPPLFDEEVPTPSDSDIDNDLPIQNANQAENDLPSTSLLWEGEPIIAHNDEEATTSDTQDHNGSDIEDVNRGRIWLNIQHLIHRDDSQDSGEYEWDTLSEASCEIGIDVFHAYTTQSSSVDESSIRPNGFGPLFSLEDQASSPRMTLDIDAFATFSMDSPSLIIGDNSF